jgi:hypothetical protein
MDTIRVVDPDVFNSFKKVSLSFRSKWYKYPQDRDNIELLIKEVLKNNHFDLRITKTEVRRNYSKIQKNNIKLINETDTTDSLKSDSIKG